MPSKDDQKRLQETLTQLLSKPGVKRDGTSFDSDYYTDAQWTRFQRGRPKKMGGYASVSQQVNGPVRSLWVDNRNSAMSIHTMSQWGVQRLNVDPSSGAGGAVFDRTPGGFSNALTPLYSWTTDTMWDGGGVALPTLITCGAPDLADITSDNTGPVYFGDITATNALTQVLDADGSTPITTSGGICVIQPFLFVYGSQGLIRNSNANALSGSTGWATGAPNYADTGNYAGSKIVRGISLKGTAPSGLFLSLDSVIKASFVGGVAEWNFVTVSDASSILAKNSVIEYDGIIYWAGIDRFLAYNGSVVELPNQMSINWFFDNLNYSAANKVWATKVPRYGEIWWMYPRGSSTECNAAVIFNVRENIWYDCTLSRSAGYFAQVFRQPVWVGSENAQSTILISYTAGTGLFQIGETVTDTSNNTTGTLVRQLPGPTMNVIINGSGLIINGDSLVGSVSGATGTVNAAPQVQELDTVWVHEKGTDKVLGQTIDAIDAWFQTATTSYIDGGPLGAANEIPQGVSFNTRILKIEPDFIMPAGTSLIVTVKGQKYPMDTEVATDESPYTFTWPAQSYMTLNDQVRIVSLKFESNQAGGTFEAGKILYRIEEGSVRA